MHLVVVQYKTFLQEAQVYLKFKQEHIYLLIVAIKEGVVNDNVKFGLIFLALKWNILFFKGDVKVNVVALNRHDEETTSQN